jgi:hypothetical protein
VTAAVTVLLVGALLLLVGWRLSWLAVRVDRADARADRTWAALDAVLVRRAQWATRLVSRPAVDPATALLVSDAAAAALEPDLSRPERERAESDLSHVLAAVGPGLGPRGYPPSRLLTHLSLSRRLHNDAVATARSLHRRRLVRLFRLARRRVAPEPFEMAEDRLPVWPPAAGARAAYDVGPITLRALPPPSGDQYAQPASMRSIGARPAPHAPSSQRAGRT